ncbi:hypothetical protein AVT69_gp224 [Pseudomonas phage PhiPA3]|uniref:Uncharacterized protein 226 n=1 Tax=Pseudomonas phage PhiPA3 TaxID=998086 RepID=F8SJ69_BPPA3|nr:hypothetical protein AVT69_gp224 [Pseudomonas phage PhiPA3]AEH03649.1 hypothetical protein [Pseudomonas phage PhiPA3]
MRYILLCLLVLAGSVWGNPVKDPVVYKHVPYWYTVQTPKEISCVYTPGANMGMCGVPNYPDEVTVSVTRRSDYTEERAYRVATYIQYVCIDGVCSDAYGAIGGVLEGEVGITYWELPRGYYVTTEQGQYKAYKHGNGPLAQRFPIRDVLLNGESIDGFYVSVEQTQNLYNVHCNVQTQRCEYLGRELTLLELAQLVPFVKTDMCDAYLCYINSNKAMVAGINPDRKDIYVGLR